ncbi:MAG: hypothetical protein A2X28_04355 [Elusimicrobia bacterium GWA2_56_46]|nr:MAG: hypothetical protein A2X28_04355 [Elusimicrobia bacterium GWA2_56_46]OGR56108.1 MAG: hypothetical protein A2X39_07775 [Elusimicrobia bacterium GWC2_56_31]HBB66148.1 hypothetical protein [Elusimicrobiota bacterium]HBW22944.1 hypothetical protein [Elusimicrobiota bacterium]
MRNFFGTKEAEKRMGKMSGFRFLIILCFILHPSSFILSAHAADSQVGTSGAVFMKIPTGSPRAQALGNCGVSIVEGTEAMTINPAGVASSQLREAGFSYLSWFQDYSGQYMAYVHPVGQSVIGVNVAYYGIKGFDVRDQAGIPQYGEDVKVRNSYGTLTLAKSFFLERLLVGVSAKEVMEDNYTEKYNNLVFDGGVVLKVGRKLSLGWSGANFSGKKDQVVRIQRLGLAYSPNPFITALLESKSYSDRRTQPGGGVEFNLPEEVIQVGRVSVRTGYTGADDYGKNYDDKTLDTLGLSKTSGWSFGIGIYTAQAMGYGMSLDYTMVPYGALGKSSQIMVKVQF